MSEQESFRDQLSRLQGMAEGNETWDLSTNDELAIAAVLASHYELCEALKAVVDAYGVGDGGKHVGYFVEHARSVLAKVHHS